MAYSWQSDEQWNKEETVNSDISVAVTDVRLDQDHGVNEVVHGHHFSSSWWIDELLFVAKMHRRPRMHQIVYRLK